MPNQALFVPFHDRVLVQPLDMEDDNPIRIPDGAKEKPRKGTVVAVGPGVMGPSGLAVPMLSRVGDVVYYGKFSGHEIDAGGETLIVMREEEILGRDRRLGQE